VARRNPRPFGVKDLFHAERARGFAFQESAADGGQNPAMPTSAGTRGRPHHQHRWFRFGREFPVRTGVIPSTLTMWDAGAGAIL
jgi:hypothetical protein